MAALSMLAYLVPDTGPGLIGVRGYMWNGPGGVFQKSWVYIEKLCWKDGETKVGRSPGMVANCLPVYSRAGGGGWRDL